MSSNCRDAWYNLRIHNDSDTMTTFVIQEDCVSFAEDTSIQNVRVLLYVLLVDHLSVKSGFCQNPFQSIKTQDYFEEKIVYFKIPNGGSCTCIETR
jgi:hypothetical protein